MEQLRFTFPRPWFCWHCRTEVKDINEDGHGGFAGLGFVCRDCTVGLSCLIVPLDNAGRGATYWWSDNPASAAQTLQLAKGTPDA